MKAVILVLVTLLSVPAQASERPLLAAIAAANVLDVVTTHAALASGRGVEGNPVMQSPAALGLKAGATAVEILTVRSLWRSGRKRTATVLALGLVAGNTAIAVHNLRVR